MLTPEVSGSSSGGNMDATCGATRYEAKQTPLDILIVLDQSGSMTRPVGDAGAGGENRWKAVTKAIVDFIQQPEASGLSVGMTYFGLTGTKPACSNFPKPNTCETESDCGPGCGPCVPLQNSSFSVCKEAFEPLEAEQCISTNYARAELPIAPLPDNVQPIIDSLARHLPVAETTPTSAALQGSLDFCKQWRMSHLDRTIVNVLATDGEASICEREPAKIASIAESAFLSPWKVRTFVIGIGDDVAHGVTTLGAIAKAGGTTQAYLVSDADAGSQFLKALNQIRTTTALSCSYEIPDTMGQKPDYAKVNVRHTPSGSGSGALIPKVAGTADCGDRDGWYYDDDAHPTRILACDATCQSFTADVAGKVEIEVGCKTIVARPK